MTSSEAWLRFRELVDRGDDAVPVAEAALLVAAEEYPSLNVNAALLSFDSLAEELRQRSGPKVGLEGLCGFLFQEKGFRGNREDYYAPDNSYLNRVLEQRLGIPITLSVVAMEVGRRVGVPLEGVGFPGHFLLRFDGGPTPCFLDAFAEGALLFEEQLEARLRASCGPTALLLPEYLQPATGRQMLIRILTNLRLVYQKQGDAARELRALKYLAAAEPQNQGVLKETGLLLWQSGDHRSAIGALEAYLKLQPEPQDLPDVKSCLAQMVELYIRRN